jgi:hypothetical protein
MREATQNWLPKMASTAPSDGPPGHSAVRILRKDNHCTLCVSFIHYIEILLRFLQHVILAAEAIPIVIQIRKFRKIQSKQHMYRVTWQPLCLPTCARCSWGMLTMFGHVIPLHVPYSMQGKHVIHNFRHFLQPKLWQNWPYLSNETVSVPQTCSIGGIPK